MTLTKDQVNFIESVATLGTPSLARELCKVSFFTYQQWISENEEFRQFVSNAKDDYRDGINETIVTLAKRNLLNLLQNGITEVETTTEWITDKEGEVTGERKKIRRVYKGVPIAAISRALDLIPELQAAIETLVEQNALPAANLEAIKMATYQHEKNLRDAVNGKQVETVTVGSEMIADIQSKLFGG